MDECKPLALGQGRRGSGRGRGKAVQVDPIKPKLQPFRTKRLNLNYDKLFSNFGFKSNLRRYTRAGAGGSEAGSEQGEGELAESGESEEVGRSELC